MQTAVTFEFLIINEPFITILIRQASGIASGIASGEVTLSLCCDVILWMKTWPDWLPTRPVGVPALQSSDTECPLHFNLDPGPSVSEDWRISSFYWAKNPAKGRGKECHLFWCCSVSEIFILSSSMIIQKWMDSRLFLTFIFSTLIFDLFLNYFLREIQKETQFSYNRKKN